MSDAAEAGVAGFSLSRLVLALLALLLAATGALWLRGAAVFAPADEVYLEEAHVHGAVSSLGVGMDGRIERIHVELGDRVQAGELVVTLRNAAHKADVEAATAHRERLKAELDRAKLADAVAAKEAQATLQQARNGVEAASARLDAARAAQDLQESQLDRAETLAERGALPEADLDTAREAAIAARTRVARRWADLESRRADVTDAQLEVERAEVRAAARTVLRARIAEAEAELARQRALLSRTRIRAVESGVVVALPSREGNSVRPDDPILDIWRTDRTWMRAWVSEDEVARIDVGDPAEIRIDAIGDRVIEGRVRRVLVARDGEARRLPGAPVSPLLPEESRFAVQVRFEAEAANGDRLLPGMSGNVRIRVSGPPEDGPSPRRPGQGRAPRSTPNPPR